MEPGDVFYLYTDGFEQQFGGKIITRYSGARFLKFLKSIRTRPMAEQKAALEAEFAQWKGTEDQVDDITVVGLMY